MQVMPALVGAEHLCEKLDKTLVIALDEFQQVAEIKDKRVDALMRTYLQRMHRVSFIFSGSKKSILSNLFIDKSRPLYGMATSISIGGIDVATLKQYCSERLGQPFKEGAFEALYNQVRGQTKLILQVCYWLYADQKDPTLEGAQAVLGMVNQEKTKNSNCSSPAIPVSRKRPSKPLAVMKAKGGDFQPSCVCHSNASGATIVARS